MSKEVIAAFIGTGGAIVAALIAFLKKEGTKGGSTVKDATGTVVQNSQDVVIAAYGGTVIQNASPAQLDEIRHNVEQFSGS